MFRLTSKTKTTTEYEFTSIGPRGEIRKTILFSLIEYNCYNLAFGEKDVQTGNVDDNINSGNNDHEKILTTVAAVVETFTTEHPEAFVYAKGSTPSRTRLYRICITKYWNDITDQFVVLGLQNGQWQHFIQNQTYNAFLGKKKSFEINN
ncbi:DUF6934 family protein [Chitinophaga filiformis]|uniref:Uncharacterized protein n=1 Tax=Chitinophaga filiformis TaxID=104663 RepID=A0ABY4HWN0_CHIFI|nr:hypothetical protein [Chitinophaga filiformis]UPK67858.1 hypothetical protein MYF79_23180 [Chitinophaga filiformis]